MGRRQVTDALERLAFAAELLEDERARTWARAAWAIRNLEGDVEEMRESGALAKTRGVGKGVLGVIDEVLEGKKPGALMEMEAKLPEGLFAVRRVKGLGPKKVKQLWSELTITSLGELEYACRENRLVDLKGFGRKTQQKVLEQIERIRETEGLLRRDQAEAVLGPVLDALEEVYPQVEPAGEVRRGLELVRELVVLVEGEALIEGEALVEGEALAEAQAIVDAARPPELKVQVALADAETFGARLVWLSSADAHRAALSLRAEARGMRFDAGGLWMASPDELAPLGTPEEDDVYRALGLVPTAPERREEGVPLVEAGRAVTPLVTIDDLRGALHNHTVASDGSHSLEEMRDAAAARGLEYLHISEHSHSAFYARGLDAERLAEQLRAIEALNAGAPECVLLSGVESDILAEGELDYDEDVLARLDVVIASVHRRHGQDAAQMTARMVAAAKNRMTDVVGHPTGRLLLGRAPSAFDVDAFFDACAESGCAVELNANPHRLDLNETHLAMAKERGLLVSIAADAHATRELDNLAHGVTIARRAGLTAEDVLNARSLPELRRWVSARRSAK